MSRCRCLTDGLYKPLTGDGRSIRSLPLERSRATSTMEGAVERCALNHALNPGSVHPPSKCQHVSGLGSNHEMLFIDRAFHTAGLIRPFEVAGDGRPFLLQVQVLRGGCSIRILAVQDPLAGNTGRLLLWRWLLCERRTACHQPKTNIQNRIPIPLHKSSDPLTSLEKIYSNLHALSPLLTNG
jgi:hypothetical protein